MIPMKEHEESDSAAAELEELVKDFRRITSCDPSETLFDDSTRDVLNDMRNQSQIMVAKAALDPWLVNEVDCDVFVTYFRKYLALVCCSKGRDYLSSPRNRIIANMIKLNMLVWNVSDRLQSFAFKLVTSQVHVHLIQLLRKPQLHPSVCHIEQNARLLVHSCIGILHNIINHIPQTRGAYRNLDAVRALSAFVTSGERSVLKLSNQIAPSGSSSELHYLSLRTSALLLLAYLVDENESNTLHTTQIHMEYILAALQDALYFPPGYYSRTYGYHALELLEGLQHLAGPDQNKRLLIKNGAMKVVETALNEAAKAKNAHPSHSPDDRAGCTINPDSLAIATLEFLWALTFVTESHQSLAQGSDFRRLFERFATERDWSRDCQLVAQGILWTLGQSVRGVPGRHPRTIEEMMAEDRRHHNPSGHLMISYQHSTKPIMLRVRDELRKRGYRVWMDVDYMCGSFVDAMADAIESAAALVLGVSQSFKNSPHCRQEVRYAYELGVPMYPLQLEPDFFADGWLGLILATIIYIPLSNDSMVEDAVNKLAKELKNTGRYSPSPNNDPVDSRNSEHSGSSTSLFSDQYQSLKRDRRKQSTPSSARASLLRDNDSVIEPGTPHLTGNSEPRSGSQSGGQRNSNQLMSTSPITPFSQQLYDILATWSSRDVSAWLKKYGLSTYCSALADLDGPLLFELARLRLVAPESLSFSLRHDLKMGLIDQLKLHRALASLPFESQSGS